MDHHFVFVCGLHRSGTSVLFRSLRDHPDISGFENTDSFEDEGMHLQSVYQPSGAYGGAGAFGFHPEAHLTEDSSLVTEANRQKLLAEWSPFWDLQKKFLLEKSPPNLIRTRFLQAMFPESSFIVMMRHPLAVSYATRAWYRHFRINWRSLSSILEHWLVCHEIFLEDQKHLRNKPLIIKYERFVAEPQLWVNRVQDMLGIEHHPTGQKILSNVNQKYFGKWQKESSGLLSGLNSRRIIKRFEERCRAFGYSLVDPAYDGLFSE
ncbi:MAG: sulfotransferase family protein [Bacteroidota bacterium]